MAWRGFFLIQGADTVIHIVMAVRGPEPAEHDHLINA